MKWLRRIALGVVVVALAATVGGYLLLDALAARAVQHGGEYAMGVPTHVERVSVRPVRGRIALHRFEADNPEGFRRQRFLAIEHSSAVVEPRSLWRETVVVPQLHLRGLRLELEHDLAGRSNYEPVLARLHELGQRTPDARRYRIGELVLTDVSVVVDNPLPLGPREAVTFEIEQLRLTDVGGVAGSDGEGVLGSELASLIVRTVIDAVADEVAGRAGRWGVRW